jgi:calmodulin
MIEQTQFLPLGQRNERPYPVQNPPAIDFNTLPPQVLNAYRKRFDAIDLNKDGIITLREIATVGKVFGYKLTKPELCEIFGKSDIDDSGTITFDEFVKALWDRANKSKAIGPVRQKFRQYDRYGKGFITSDEAYPILRDELGFDMNKTETLIDMFDKNQDYRLSIQEFTEFYQKVEELKAEITKAFHEWDRDGDGYVTFVEAKAVMGPKGFSDEDIQTMIAKYDEDKDGRLNYTEFACFWDIPLFT